jgi:DNA (cytosine-5)-methyltransferase 1
VGGTKQDATLITVLQNLKTVCTLYLMALFFALIVIVLNMKETPMPIRYLSLFSGFGGAELAFAQLGMECVAVCEIDPAACRVLSYRYPSIPNLGDITTITEEQIKSLGKIDLVIFGFPCQDLSVAGKRAGLKDKEGGNTRSGLFFDAMRVVRWSGARWSVAENVPGLFSSEQGRDFATVVGEMSGVRVDVPDGGWSNSGFLASSEGIVEWAVLDAQFFGVPQRRRRVFALRDSGDWASRPPILLEPESLLGHPAPRLGASRSHHPCAKPWRRWPWIRLRLRRGGQLALDGGAITHQDPSK